MLKSRKLAGSCLVELRITGRVKWEYMHYKNGVSKMDVKKTNGYLVNAILRIRKELGIVCPGPSVCTGCCLDISLFD